MLRVFEQANEEVAGAVKLHWMGKYVWRRGIPQAASQCTLTRAAQKPSIVIERAALLPLSDLLN